MTAEVAPPRLSQKEIALFFYPLLLNVQLMSVSHSVINAFLARQEEFVVALAGFSVAMVLHLFVASPSYQNHTVTIAMVRGRRSRNGVLLFVVLVAVYVSLALGLLAFTPVGELVLTYVLGVTGPVAAAARESLALLVALPFITGFRGYFQGLVIRARRTGLVSFATGVRIAALFALLALGQRWYSGAALGAFALTACVAVETALMAFFAWRAGPLPLHPAAGDEKGAGEILRFAFPLAWSSCLQQTIPLLINAVISRLPDGPQALAAFGVIRGFIFLLAGPLRNIQQAFLTLAREAGDWLALVIFTRRTGIGMGVLTLLIAFPLSGPVLGGLMGLDAAMRDYIALPLAGCALYPLLYGGANLLRGWFTGTHRTPLLGRSTFYKSTLLLLCWGLFTLWPPPLPGVVVAVALLTAAELCEAGYLRRQKRRLTAA